MHHPRYFSHTLAAVPLSEVSSLVRLLMRICLNQYELLPGFACSPQMIWNENRRWKELNHDC
jgi:hypothetical protein